MEQRAGGSIRPVANSIQEESTYWPSPVKLIWRGRLLCSDAGSAAVVRIKFVG